MTITRSQSRDELRQALAPFDDLSLGRPGWMLLPDYLDQLCALGLLSSQDARGLLDVYERACYGALGVARETWEASLVPLQLALAKAQQLTPEQREAWQAQMLRPSQPESPVETDEEEEEAEEGQEPTAEAQPFQLPNVLRPPRRESSGPADIARPQAPAASNTPTTPAKSSAPSGRVGLSPRAIVGLVVLFVLSIGASLWIGAKNYEDIIGIRYNISKRIATSLDMPHSPIPARYSYRAVTRRKVQLERWLRWWRTQRPLFHIRRHYRRKLRRNPTLSRKVQQQMWSRLANSHAEEDSYVYANFFFDKALALRPNDPELLNEYAWMLTQTKDPLFRDAPKALALAERAFRLKRAHFIADTLAIAASQNGQHYRAIKLSRWALKHAPEDDKEDYEEQLEAVLKAAKAAKATIPPKHDVLTFKPTAKPARRLVPKKQPVAPRNRAQKPTPRRPKTSQPGTRIDTAAKPIVPANPVTPRTPSAIK